MRNRATTPLSKAKVRMSMSKYNLYNLSRITLPSYKFLNFFQQKWKSKSALRDYHGEQVREKQWERMFSRKLRSVVPMDPAYLAGNDGSNESAGRGAGLDKKEGKRNVQHTPHMLMTFAPLERRLDVAIFRALFASSARQARQFVVHGAVKVNGKVMRYPGYLLNPGDMFQVNPERVMYALGQPKQPSQEGTTEEGIQAVEERQDEGENEAKAEPTATEVDIERDPKEVLKDLMAQAKTILASPKEKIGAKRKQDLRAFSQAIRKLMSRAGRDTIMTDNLEPQFQEIQHQLKIQRQHKDQGTSALPSEKHSSPTQPEATPSDTLTPELSPSTDTNYISETEYNELYSALSAMVENEAAERKPYATPWMPREFLSAFTFIPRYLEVNQSICAAIYLRHPVARPGLAEVPSPLPETINANAFAWYLRRR